MLNNRQDRLKLRSRMTRWFLFMWKSYLARRWWRMKVKPRTRRFIMFRASELSCEMRAFVSSIFICYYSSFWYFAMVLRQSLNSYVVHGKQRHFSCHHDTTLSKEWPFFSQWQQRTPKHCGHCERWKFTELENCNLNMNMGFQWRASEHLVWASRKVWLFCLILF